MSFLGSWFADLAAKAQEVTAVGLSSVESAATAVREQALAQHQKFLDEKEKYMTSAARVPRGEDARLPWERVVGDELTRARVAGEIRSLILQLSGDDCTFVDAPPEADLPRFDMKDFVSVAKALLKEDPGLGKARFRLVPRRVSEAGFWRHYFFRVGLVEETYRDFLDGGVALHLRRGPTEDEAGEGGGRRGGDDGAGGGGGGGSGSGGGGGGDRRGATEGVRGGGEGAEPSQTGSYASPGAAASGGWKVTELDEADFESALAAALQEDAAIHDDGGSGGGGVAGSTEDVDALLRSELGVRESVEVQRPKEEAEPTAVGSGADEGSGARSPTEAAEEAAPAPRTPPRPAAAATAARPVPAPAAEDDFEAMLEAELAHVDATEETLLSPSADLP